MAEELPPPSRRRDRDDDRDDDRPRAKSGGLGTGATVGIVVGVLTLVVCVCGVPVLIGLTIPATSKVREAAARMTSTNNMKQMGLGLASVEDQTNTLQGPLAAGLFGPATGHSFRVGLLPYLEQDDLYKQIDLTQPWNSARNAPATGSSVKTYLDPSNPASLGTATPYRMFVGPGAIFDGTGKPVKMQDILDGTSNTIYFVAATQPVPWASPQELPYGPGVPLPPLGANPNAKGFYAAFADGSVRFLRSTTPEADLRSLIEKADGRVVDLD